MSCNDPSFTRYVTLLKQGPSVSERTAERLQEQCFSDASLLPFFEFLFFPTSLSLLRGLTDVNT